MLALRRGSCAPRAARRELPSGSRVWRPGLLFFDWLEPERDVVFAAEPDGGEVEARAGGGYAAGAVGADCANDRSSRRGFSRRCVDHLELAVLMERDQEAERG